MEQCLRLLRSNSDEEKFVGLYLVTKLKIKTADPSTGGGELVSALRLVWDAIGITFLQRMLRTTDQKVEGAEAFSYRGLALSVLAAFSVDETLATDPRFVSLVPTLVSFIHPRSLSNQEIGRDALQCLIGASHSTEGINKIIENDGLSVLMLGISDDQPPDLIKARLHLADKLLHFMRSNKVTPPLMGAIPMLRHLAALFRQNQRALKFIIMDRLSSILFVCFDSQLQAEEKRNFQVQDHGEWIENVRVGLFYILASKVGRVQKERALALCTSVLRYFGDSWAVGPLPSVHTNDDMDRERSASRFVEVMVLQTGIELRLLLDSYMHPEIMLPEQDGERGKQKVVSGSGRTSASLSSLPSWEQEAKRNTTKLPPESMMYAPSFPLPASSESASYAIEDVSDEEDIEIEAEVQSSSSSSSSSSSTPHPPADPLAELLPAPPEDLQSHFENMVSVYYEILEHTITSLAASHEEDDEQAKGTKSQGSSSWASLDAKTLVNMKRILSDIFETILDFVRDVQRGKEEEYRKAAKRKEEAPMVPTSSNVRLTLTDLESMDLENTTNSKAEQPTTKTTTKSGHIIASDLVLVATMRLLGLWISHDAETFKDSIQRILPFLINLRTDSAQTMLDPLSFLLPGLVPLTQEDDFRDKFIDAGGHVRLLAFTAAEVAEQWRKQSSQDENFGPLVSCLGILLNLVCLEEGLINHRDPTTLACFLPILLDVIRLTDVSATSGGIRHAEKTLVQAHALVAAFTILKFHTPESLRHHWAHLEEDMHNHGVTRIPALTALTSAYELLAKSYFEMCALHLHDEELWNDIAELWFIATEGVRASMSVHPELRAAVHGSSWLPKAMSSADQSSTSAHVRAALHSVVEM